jgi:hypothetical protein
MAKFRLPRLAYNFLSSVGAAIAIISGLLVVTMLIISIFTKLENPYLGIFSFIILPVVLIFGLLLIPLGMWRQWRKEKRGERIQKPKWPYVDLNIKAHRNAFIIFLFGTFFFIIFTAVGSYQAFHFSESVTFCGTTCHKLMEPEYTAYQNSPHARVPCVACHVGPGAGWYTQSKLSGAYQVYATIFNKYPRPIPRPIKNLRPARVTCEQCHWPAKFYSSQGVEFNHYEYDSANTHWPIKMLVKVGGGTLGAREALGIHWHVSHDIKVEYIARDRKRQDLPWVKYTDIKTGQEDIYQDADNPLTQEEIDTLPRRTMDCVDCHNSPSHIYHSPDEAIDNAIELGQINSDIPEIKSITVQAMAIEYDSTEEAMQKISDTLTTFYKNKYPEYYKQNKDLIERAVSATQYEFSQNIFPFMKVRWSVYPNNIGHFYSVGCFRCHDGNHEDSTGQAISHSCTNCHAITAQGPSDTTQINVSENGLDFQHPVDIYGAWQGMGCYECHTGTQP